MIPLPDIPIRACWLLTSRCNYGCQFCHRVLDKRELYYNEAVMVLDKLIDAGIKKVSFSGGEPMMWNGLFDLITYAKKRGVMTMMISNASFMTEELLDEYAQILDWITFPIDGSNEEVQSAMTRNPGHLGRVFNLIKRIEDKKLPVKVKVNTVFAQPNRNDLTNIAKIIFEHPVIERWKIFQFYPVRGLALRFQEKFIVSEDEFLKAKQGVIEAYPERQEKHVFFATNTDLERTYFTLAPDGTVYLSYEGKDYFMGDLKTQTVEEIWKNKMYDKQKHENQASWVLEYTDDTITKTMSTLKHKSGVTGGGIL